jgi:hypothetical protein
MGFRRLTLLLAGVFVGAFACDLILIFVVTSGKYPPVWADEAENLKEALLAAFGVPLGAIVGGIIASRKRRDRVAVGIVAVFLGLAIAWCSLSILPLAQLSIVHSVKVDDCISSLQSLTNRASFLISGMLVLLFGAKRDT